MPGPSERFPSIPGLHFQEKLGSGAVGSVYLARDERLRKLVAVKVLRRELAGNRLYIERLRREANLSMRLNHPNIVKGIDLGEAEGTLYFVMEYVDGKTLKTILRERGRLEEDEVIELGLQVARALDHAYRHGVVHRDIKPGNLLASPDGTFKLADLGLARRPDDSSVTRDGVTLGTPHYISPEQALDPSRADVRSDLYSLGATLYHAATGGPPFESETVAGVLSQVLDFEKAAPIPDDVPLSRNFQLVLRRLLVKDPTRRYASPDDLIRDLERVRRHERPQVSLFDVSPRVGRGIRRSLTALAAAAGVILVAWGSFRLAQPGVDEAAVRAEKQLAENLAEIEKGVGGDPPSIADRYRRVGALLALPTLTPALRVRAVDLRARIEEQLLAALGSLERSCQGDLTDALSEGRFGDASNLAERGFPPRFEALFGTSEGLPESLGARTDQFLTRARGEVAAAIEQAEEELDAQVPVAVSALENSVADRVAEGRYRSALDTLDAALGEFEVPGGPSLRRMPAAVRERVADALQPRLADLRAYVLTAARGAAHRIAQRLQREHDRLEETLRAGIAPAVASEFEDLAVKTLEDVGYRKEEWPSQVTPEPAKLREDLASSLRGLERERARAEAERAFSELDEQLWKRLRERAYVSARNEWASRIDRASFAPMRERMARRLRYCEDLASLRARAEQRFVKAIGKRVSLTLRSGGAVAGRLTAVEQADDDFLLTLQEGTAPSSRFSVLSTSDVETWSDLGDGPGDRYVRGVFCLAEGQLDRARAEFAAARARAEEGTPLFENAVMALADADALKLLTGSGAGAREARFEEAKRKARAFAAIGEAELAREWYGTARREAEGFAAGDLRLTELGAEIERFEAAAREQERARALDRAFPGARVRDLGEGMVEVTYEFNDSSRAAPLELGDGWSMTAAGAVFAGSRGGELARAPGARLHVNASVKSPVRVVARISVPYEGKEPPEPLRAFLAFGRAVAFAGARGRAGSAAFTRGGFEGIEGEARALSVSPGKATLGLLRGGTHRIEIAVDADGKGAAVQLDGHPIARAENLTLGDVFELRSNAPVVWHSLRIEGKLAPKR